MLTIDVCEICILYFPLKTYLKMKILVSLSRSGPPMVLLALSTGLGYLQHAPWKVANVPVCPENCWDRLSSTFTPLQVGAVVTGPSRVLRGWPSSTLLPSFKP